MERVSGKSGWKVVINGIPDCFVVFLSILFKKVCYFLSPHFMNGLRYTGVFIVSSAEELGEFARAQVKIIFVWTNAADSKCQAVRDSTVFWVTHCR